ncbi:hypothetical protein ABEF95_002516 [Exophiala dermatitidis]|uniref:RRM domain-containing protein n=1 Tax=Exophiala dermatitidis (strain ATCC 34100 / CBS 525.76 / NIH/UT8656) TaxID=858893 RepID=H6BRD2_EXODN|nr:uncharacterized protein HMPREF1120_02878 [Exophiala dermatitidis NIH/UT8656]EHY54713.1 hypothetical protein HMPREF1120_02878 [Exophiala dermatitidis NIH/UT8656]
MAADEDNFDIDIYGDGEGEGDLGTESGQMDFKVEEEEEGHNFEAEHDETALAENTEDNLESEQQQQSHGFDGTEDQGHRQTEHQESSNNEPVAQVPTPQQGTKRKESSDDRPIDHGATTALMISDLHWWITEDDIRGWANEAAAEDELKDISFSEHKVNGKSKGQAYVEFSSLQAATAAKHKIESVGGNQPGSRKHSVTFTVATQNPFKTLPKEAPRARDDRPPVRGSFHSTSRGDHGYGAMHQGYRGGRGGGFNRGGGGYNNHNQYNRNFSGPMGGYNNNNMMGFQGNMGVGNNYGGFNRGGMMGNPMRGNMGGMRGGRGGMNMMPMAGGMGMGMGNMNMGMNPMMAGMGMAGFQGNQFNPGMFNAGQGGNFGGGGGDWNQHGVKRQRQE